MRAGHNQYPPMAGVPALREAVAAKIEALYGARYDPGSEITVTAGATQAILTAILACVHPGDEVIVLEPCYDSYGPNIELAGGRVVRVPLTPGSFRPDFDGHRRAPYRHARGPSSSTARTTPAPRSGALRRWIAWRRCCGRPRCC